jgi:hypothetical protein
MLIVNGVITQLKDLSTQVGILSLELIVKRSIIRKRISKQSQIRTNLRTTKLSHTRYLFVRWGSESGSTFERSELRHHKELLLNSYTSGRPSNTMRPLNNLKPYRESK